MSTAQYVIEFLLGSIVLSVVACEPTTVIPSVPTTIVSASTSTATAAPVVSPDWNLDPTWTSGKLWSVPKGEKMPLESNTQPLRVAIIGTAQVICMGQC